MATQAQIQANRRNAQHSTCPTTQAGLAAMSQNRTTHGLAGEFKPANDQEYDAYRDTLNKIVAAHDITTEHEVELASKMAEAMIRSNRALAYQDQCIENVEFGDEESFARAQKQLDLFIRYQAQHERSYQRYAAELRKFISEKNRHRKPANRSIISPLSPSSTPAPSIKFLKRANFSARRTQKIRAKGRTPAQSRLN